MKRFQSYMLVALLGILMSICSLGRAQIQTATIYGRVSDPSGAVVPNASVQITDEDTSLVLNGKTNDEGDFTIPYIPPGNYDLKVESKGFKSYRSNGIKLWGGQKTNLNITLQIGATTQSVTVTSAAPLVNAVNGQKNINIGSHQVQQLPIMNRDVTSILDLGAGTSGGGTTISLNGLPPRGFSFSVDGVDASPDSEFPSLSLYQNINYVKGVSLEAVKQVVVSKDIFSAETGDTVSGNVNIITKSGTNHYHGSLFENYQAGGLNAVNHLLGEHTSLVFHQFGGSLGGPIKKNKLFFFTAFEGYRSTSAQPLSGFVPSNQARQEILAALPSSAPYFNAWPLPTEPANPGDVTAFFLGSSAAQRRDNTDMAKIDYTINSKTRLSGRFSFGHPYKLQPRVAIGNPRIYTSGDHNLSLTLNRIWTPTLESETMFGYNFSNLDRADHLFSVGIPNVLGAGLPDPGQARLFNKGGSVSTINQNFAKMAGQHSLKFGGMFSSDYDHRHLGDAPDYSFATLSDILANSADSADYNFGVNPFQLHRWLAGVFVQDDYKATRSLMLNLGIRWDYASVPTERDGRLFNRNGPFGALLPPHLVWNPSYRMVSPRVGFAWSVGHSQKTVVRGGFGVFFIPYNFFAGPVEIVLNNASSPDRLHLNNTQLQNFGIQYPDGNAQVQPLVTNTTFVGSTAIDPNWKPSYSLQWALHVERQLSNTLALDVGYVGNHGVKLIYDPLLNLPDRVTGIVPHANFGNFRYYQNQDSSVYNSLQVTLKKRYSRALEFSAAYTYASNLSYFVGDYTCCGKTSQPQDLNRRYLNRAPTPYFNRHTFTGQVVYDIPTMHRFQNGPESFLFGGWQISGLWQAYTGSPLDINESLSNAPGSRPDMASGYTYSKAVRSNYRTPLANGSYQYLVQAAFSKIPISPVSREPIRIGNLGRNAIFGPGFWNTDMSLAKQFRVHEKYSFLLKMDLFNALNHTNYTGVQTKILSSQFGRITGVAPGRTMQLSARFDF